MTRRSSAAARSIQSPTPRTAEPPDLLECLARGRQGRDDAGLEEADRLYGADLHAEMEAIASGAHPLQRGLNSHDLQKSKEKASATLAHPRAAR